MQHLESVSSFMKKAQYSIPFAGSVGFYLLNKRFDKLKKYFAPEYQEDWNLLNEFIINKYQGPLKIYVSKDHIGIVRDFIIDKFGITDKNKIILMTAYFRWIRSNTQARKTNPTPLDFSVLQLKIKDSIWSFIEESEKNYSEDRLYNLNILDELAKIRKSHTIKRFDL